MTDLMTNRILVFLACNDSVFKVSFTCFVVASEEVEVEVEVEEVAGTDKEVMDSCRRPADAIQPAFF